MRIIDNSVAREVADVMADAQSESGFSDEETIPGLIQRVIQISGDHPYGDQMLDEAANLLADGGVDD